MAQNPPVPAGQNIQPAGALPPAVSSNDPRPPAPSPIIGRRMGLVRQAGIGGPVSYARGGVLELGGGLSYLSGHHYTNLSVTPSVGYFITNNFELSVLTTLAYNRSPNPDGNVGHNTSLVAVVEPSVHLPIVDHLFVFAGLGAGVAYHQQAATAVGFALAPRVGFDVMVGRSGVLTPSFNVNWSTNSVTPKAQEAVKADSNVNGRLVAVRTLLGASIAYKVMF